jgi:hypothetical protein
MNCLCSAVRSSPSQPITISSCPAMHIVHVTAGLQQRLWKVVTCACC